MTVTEPGWLVEVSERSRRELSELPPTSQPSWYRWVASSPSGDVGSAAQSGQPDTGSTASERAGR